MSFTAPYLPTRAPQEETTTEEKAEQATWSASESAYLADVLPNTTLNTVSTVSNSTLVFEVIYTFSVFPLAPQHQRYIVRDRC